MADPVTSARIHSLQTKPPSVVYTARPTTSSLTLTNTEWQIHTNLISGCHPTPTTPHCICKYDLTLPNADRYHVFNCHLLKKSLLDPAHNFFVLELTNILNLLGFYAVKELQPNDATKQRPDISRYLSVKHYSNSPFSTPALPPTF